MKNITKKLAKARIMFQSKGVTMSGENTFAKYKYYELSDILPVTNKINEELGILTMVSFTADLATCEVIDSESGEKITFTSPMSTANLKGCHDVQNLGAVQTYIKRYLYQNVYEITESDVLDGTMGKDEKTPPKPDKKPDKQPEQKEQPKITDFQSQLKELMLSSNGKITKEMISETMLRKFSKTKANDLNIEQFDALVKELTNEANS